jgi:hypothetical protein
MYHDRFRWTDHQQAGHQVVSPQSRPSIDKYTDTLQGLHVQCRDVLHVGDRLLVSHEAIHVDHAKR